MYFAAVEPHGLLILQRAFGTLADGGGPFEQLYVRPTLYNDSRVIRVEFFEPEDLDLARARFEELRPDALAATRRGNEEGTAHLPAAPKALAVGPPQSVLPHGNRSHSVGGLRPVPQTTSTEKELMIIR